MTYRLLLSSLLLPLLLVGAGCKNTSESSDQTASTYSVDVVKSPAYTETKEEADIRKEMNLRELLSTLNIPFQTATQNGKEVFTELDAVISTLSKEWKVYINNTIPEYANLDELQVHASDEIELRYEERQ